MAQLDFALTGGNVMLSDGRLEPLNVGVRNGRIASITDQALDADETLDVGGLTVVPGSDRRALPRLLGLRLGDLPGSDPGGGEGRHHDRRRHAAGQPRDPHRAAPAGEARARAVGMPRRLRAVRRLPGRGPRRGGRACRGRHRRAQALHGRSRAAGDVPRGRHRTDPRCDAAGARGRPRSSSSTARTQRSSTSRRRASRRKGEADADAWDEARPWYSEVEAVQRVALVAEVTGCRTVIAHVTSHQVVETVRDVRSRGADVWVETCPHYLCLTTEDMAKRRPPQVESAEPQPESVDAPLASCCATAMSTRSAPTTRRCRSTPGADVLDAAPGCR